MFNSGPREDKRLLRPVDGRSKERESGRVPEPFDRSASEERLDPGGYGQAMSTSWASNRVFSWSVRPVN